MSLPGGNHDRVAGGGGGEGTAFKREDEGAALDDECFLLGVVPMVGRGDLVGGGRGGAGVG